MTEKSEHLPKPPEPTPSDRFHDALSKLFGFLGESLLPTPFAAMFVGTSAWLAALFPKPFDRRMQDWLAKLQLTVNKLRDRGVKVEELREDEDFADLVLQATEAALRTKSDTKREHLRNALLNARLAGPASDVSARMFVRLVHELDELHVLILQFLKDPAAYCARRQIQIEAFHFGGRTMHGALGDLAQTAFRGEHQPILSQAIDTLTQRGLAAWNASLDVYAGGANRFLPTLGEEFLRFIAEPPE